MICHPVSVLKFGGSVLRSEDDLCIAALEIYRELETGHRVVAVVSAFGGTTDRLLERAHRRFPSSRAESLARLLATGEFVAAASLGMALDDSGIPNTVLDPHHIRLRTRGSVLDGEPAGLDLVALAGALCRVSVVVLAGFVGHDDTGQPTLLGRGGSDLTALFLADHLGATTCRLYKDVDGLFTANPRDDASARPYRSATWEEALHVGGELIQPKAVRFAREHALQFVVCAPGSRRGTTIGPAT